VRTKDDRKEFVLRKKSRFAVDGTLFVDGKMMYERRNSPIVFIGNGLDHSCVVAHKVIVLVVLALFLFLQTQTKQKDGFVCRLDDRYVMTSHCKVASSIVICAVASDCMVVAWHDGFVVVDKLWTVLFSASKVVQAKETLTSCCIHEKSVLLGTSQGTLLFCNLHTVVSRPKAHADTITDVLISNEDLLWSSCRDGRVGNWQMRENEFVLLSMERFLFPIF
jgi:hypothetical protein